MPDTSDLKLSIIICTHRRFDLLKLAINSLVNQTAPKESYEVIVVDNDNDKNPEVINIIEKAGKIINTSYIFENKLGLSYARNTGGKYAKAEYVVYMDDDAKAPINYISSINSAIKNIKPDILGGPFIPFYLSSKPKWFKDSYGEDPKKGFTGFLNNEQFISGMNICFNKSILDKVNWFDSAYGMKGNNIAYAEETVVQISAWKLNSKLRVYYDTNIYVEHLVPSHKMKLIDRFKRKYNIGKSQAYIWLEKEDLNSAKRNAPKKLIKIIFLFLVKGVPGIIFRDHNKYKFWQNYVYEEISNYFASIGQEWRLTKDYLVKS